MDKRLISFLLMGAVLLITAIILINISIKKFEEQKPNLAIDKKAASVSRSKQAATKTKTQRIPEEPEREPVLPKNVPLVN